MLSGRATSPVLAVCEAALRSYAPFGRIAIIEGSPSCARRAHSTGHTSPVLLCGGCGVNPITPRCGGLACSAMVSDGECVGAGAGAAAGFLRVLLSAWVLWAGWRRWRRRRLQAVEPVEGLVRSDLARNVTAGSYPLLNIFVSGVMNEVRWARVGGPCCDARGCRAAAAARAPVLESGGGNAQARHARDVSRTSGT